MAEFRVLISDNQLNALEEIKDVMSLTWDYNRIGGCGQFSFEIPKEFGRDRNISGFYNVRIYIKNTVGTFDLWYQGRVENKTYNVRGDQETINVSGFGYQSQLSDIYVDRDYTSKEITDMVKNILDNDIVPNTNITYSAGDITATSFTADSLKFNTDGLKAMETLADIVGGYEWGVDKDRKFFFKVRSATIGTRYPFGRKITNFSSDLSYKDIINRVIVTGGDVAGTPFSGTYNDASSQLKWGRRDKAISNSSITTAQVATQYATATFAEYSEIVRRARLDLLDTVRIEATIPIPLLEIIEDEQDTYGERFYGYGMFNGSIGYQVNRTTYKLDDGGNMTISINLGMVRPSIAEAIGQLDFQLEQLRAQRV